MKISGCGDDANQYTPRGPIFSILNFKIDYPDYKLYKLNRITDVKHCRVGNSVIKNNNNK